MLKSPCMNRLFFAGLLILLYFSGRGQLTAENILKAGVWKGAVEISPGRNFAIALEKLGNKNGNRYFFHSIDQNSYNFAIRKVEQVGDSLQLRIGSINADMVLKVNDTAAVGYFIQRSMRFPMVLKKSDQLLNKPPRPQEPIYPLPYLEEEVTIENKKEGILLAGTLTYPRKAKNRTAILLIPGSGPSDRDQSIFGHKNFLVLADQLTRSGYVVLRVDDRGTGYSTGNYATATIKDFAVDAQICLYYLQNRKEVNPSKVGVLGHSFGADIAQYLAARSSNLNFVILMAGSAETLSQTILRQTEAIYQQKGASPEAIALNSEILQTVFSSIQESSVREAAAEKLTNALVPLNEKLKAIGEEQQALIETKYPITAKSFSNLLSDAMRFDLFYDPKTSISKIRQPVLILQGEKDIQVLPDNADAILQALPAQKPAATRLVKYPSLNHLFQTCTTCMVSEYQELEETIAPVVVADIINWIKLIHK